MDNGLISFQSGVSVSGGGGTTKLYGASTSQYALRYRIICQWGNSHDIREGESHPSCMHGDFCIFGNLSSYSNNKPSNLTAAGVAAAVDKLSKNNQLKKPTMAEYDEPSDIPAKLTLMESAFADSDEKVLIKARLMAKGELTEAGKKALAIINLKANKDALVELAQELLADAEADKK